MRSSGTPSSVSVGHSRGSALWDSRATYSPRSSRILRNVTKGASAPAGRTIPASASRSTASSYRIRTRRARRVGVLSVHDVHRFIATGPIRLPRPRRQPSPTAGTHGSTNRPPARSAHTRSFPEPAAPGRAPAAATPRGPWRHLGSAHRSHRSRDRGGSPADPRRVGSPRTGGGSGGHRGPRETYRPATFAAAIPDP